MYCISFLSVVLPSKFFFLKGKSIQVPGFPGQPLPLAVLKRVHQLLAAESCFLSTPLAWETQKGLSLVLILYPCLVDSLTSES